MTPEQLLEQAISHFSRWRSSRSFSISRGNNKINELHK